MNRAAILASTLALVIPGAHAVKLNPDAMQTMQEAGSKIATQATSLLPYRLPSGKCLHVAGNLQSVPANVVIADCNGSPNQNWRFDDTGRLVNQSGTCLGAAGNLNVGVTTCADGPPFKWKPAADGRIVHSTGKCLAVQGDPNGPGSNVHAADCTGGANQQWRRP
jgi:hypothetical protein